jgi:hypothetical protein
MQMARTEAGGVVASYLLLRKAVGWIGTLLPVVLIVGDAAFSSAPLPNSLSDYYYTPMRNILVGLIKDKRAHPADDLISRLVQVSGEPPSHQWCDVSSYHWAGAWALRERTGARASSDEGVAESPGAEPEHVEFAGRRGVSCGLLVRPYSGRSVLAPRGQGERGIVRSV